MYYSYVSFLEQTNWFIPMSLFQRQGVPIEPFDLFGLTLLSAPKLQEEAVSQDCYPECIRHFFQSDSSAPSALRTLAPRNSLHKSHYKSRGERCSASQEICTQFVFCVVSYCLILPISSSVTCWWHTVYSKIMHIFCFVVVCCDYVLSDLFTDILKGHFTGTGALMWLPLQRWSNPEGYV